MALTTYQRAIIAEAKRNGGKVTTEQAVSLIGANYFRNERKYVGEALSRMVNSGLLIREKPGVFALPTEPPKPKQVTKTGEQPTLF